MSAESAALQVRRGVRLQHVRQADTLRVVTKSRRSLSYSQKLVAR
jgi:hypothetical protein